jgi:hypothetical protein
VIAYNTAEVQRLSYQAVMDSFGSVVVGAIWNSRASSGGIITNGTSVMSTVLGETKELAWLNDYPHCLSLVRLRSSKQLRWIHQDVGVWERTPVFFLDSLLISSPRQCPSTPLVSSNC